MRRDVGVPSVRQQNKMVGLVQLAGDGRWPRARITDLQLMDGWPRSDKPVIAWRRLKPQEVLVG